MRIAIVDDVNTEREIIKKYIEEWGDFCGESVAFCCFESSENFLFSWEDDKRYDLLILDIEMGKMNGMELAKKLRAEKTVIPIMFITGYDEYMQYGYDVDALHYLLKPVNKDRLYMVLDKLKTAVEEEVACVVVHTKDEVKRVAVNELLYVEANGHGSILHTTMDVFEVRETFGIIEKIIVSEGDFVKCHRAYLVNLRYCAAIKNGDLHLDNDERIPISRNNLKKVQTQFLKYYRQ